MTADMHPLCLVRSAALPRGGNIALVSPSRPGDAASISRTVAYLENRGYSVVVHPQASSTYHYLAGPDARRADQVMEAFTDPDIHAIICNRGGYGSGRILDLLDYDHIRCHPKPLVGFSDSTGLQLALYARCGLVTLSGALGDTDLAQDPPPATTVTSLFHLLTESTPLGEIATHPDSMCLRTGSATGPLIPANLALLCSLLGTRFAPDLTDAILLVEDVWEAPYRLDRMFTQLRLAGILDQIAGLALGTFRRCFVPEEMEHGPTLEEMVLDAIGTRDLPVLTGIPYGHMTNRVVLPVGTNCLLNATEHRLTLLDAAVDG